MARHADPPELQAAKGFPGKRKSKIERQIERAQSVAELLASASTETGEKLAPPALLTDPRCAPALAVWREYAPQLARLNLFGDLDRHTFSIFCVYVGEFAEAQRDILDNGFYRRVKTVSKDWMDRINPSVERRDYAQKVILDISKRFGLTPVDMISILRGQSAGVPPGGLFGGAHRPASKDGSAEQPEETGSVAGLVNGFDSPPPGPLN